MVCFFTAKPQASQPIKIVVSFSILKDIAQEITKGLPGITIFSIVPPKCDPHTYQPTPNDSRAIAESDIILLNGLNFEPGITRMIQCAESKARVSHVTKEIKPRPDLGDPHAWHDVRNAILYVKEITATLCAHDPSRSAQYKKNAEEYSRQLDSLHHWVGEQFRAIPVAMRYVVTTHDAFWYFGKAYDIQFLSPVGISTEAEASASTVAQIIDFIRAKNVKAVFVENLANSKLLEQIAQETGRAVRGILYADSLSEAGGNADTYIKMIRHNVGVMRDAF